MTETGQARPPGGTPDPAGLAAAREMQERLRPAELILLDSRAAGDHRPNRGRERRGGDREPAGRR